MNTDLGSYLRQLRERVRPEQMGLRSSGSRRVPGLRREEVAALAGVSQTYYTRLEQSQTAHASPQVLLSIARALQLTAAGGRRTAALWCRQRVSHVSTATLPVLTVAPGCARPG